MKLKRVKVPKPKVEKPSMGMGMMMDKPHPVSIHIHASGPHMNGAQADLAKQLRADGLYDEEKEGPRHEGLQEVDRRISIELR